MCVCISFFFVGHSYCTLCHGVCSTLLIYILHCTLKQVHTKYCTPVQNLKTHISCSNHVCCYTSTHTSTHKHTHAHSHTNHTCTHKHSYTNTRIYTHTRTQTHTNTCKQTHTLLCGIQYLVSGQSWQWPASQRYQRS